MVSVYYDRTPNALERSAEAIGRASQGNQTSHEGSYNPDLAWRAPACSYFGLVRQLVDACPRLEVIKRSVCIRVRRAFALGEAGRHEAVEGGAAGGQGASLPRDVL